jgi:hydrocephalus-inducing protein
VLPTLKLEQPKDYIDERTPVLKFSRLRVNKSTVLPIVLKNDGSVPATVKFDTTYHNCFKFLSAGSYTFAPKSY